MRRLRGETYGLRMEEALLLRRWLQRLDAEVHTLRLSSHCGFIPNVWADAVANAARLLVLDGEPPLVVRRTLVFLCKVGGAGKIWGPSLTRADQIDGARSAAELDTRLSKKVRALADTCTVQLLIKEGVKVWQIFRRGGEARTEIEELIFLAKEGPVSDDEMTGEGRADRDARSMFEQAQRDLLCVVDGTASSELLEGRLYAAPFFDFEGEGLDVTKGQQLFDRRIQGALSIQRGGGYALEKVADVLAVDDDEQIARVTVCSVAPRRGAVVSTVAVVLVDTRCRPHGALAVEQQPLKNLQNRQASQQGHVPAQREDEPVEFGLVVVIMRRQPPPFQHRTCAAWLLQAIKDTARHLRRLVRRAQAQAAPLLVARHRVTQRLARAERLGPDERAVRSRDEKETAASACDAGELDLANLAHQRQIDVSSDERRLVACHAHFQRLAVRVRKERPLVRALHLAVAHKAPCDGALERHRSALKVRRHVRRCAPPSP